MAKAGVLVKKLESWFAQNARELPWRENPEPYWVWLSEIMLQQTQVATVLPYFEKFTKRFPTVEKLARAPLDEVLKLWAGLGYYSRARNLHRGAQALAARLKEGQGFPATRDEWLAVPGVGEYTAGAICSIALNQPEPIVDGNVVRVLSRVFAVGKIDAQKSEIWSLARTLVTVRGATPRALNQALMELGATVCKPKSPQCLRCPIQGSCEGKLSPEKYPPPKPKKEWTPVQEKKWILLDRGARGRESAEVRIYLERNGPQGWREGLWDFPNAGSLKIVSLAKALDEFSTRYVVTTHRITREHQVFQVGRQALKSATGEWFSSDALPALPSPVAKVIQKLLRQYG